MSRETFGEVFNTELELIAARRSHHGQSAKVPACRSELELQQFALDQKLFGICFSGGGIRSACFNLGVLQKLAEYGLLRHVDYLSMVSGGGYIGAWLMAWLKREGHKSAPAAFNNLERQLVPNRVVQARADRPELAYSGVVADEPEPIHHLRAYSKYLSPRLGLLSADSWTLIAIYLRNLLLNQLFLFFVAILVVLATRCVVRFFNWPGGETFRRAVLIATVAFCAIAFIRIRLEMAGRRRENRTPEAAAAWKSVRWSHWFIVVPLLVASGLISWMYSTDEIDITPDELYAHTDLRLPTWELANFVRPANESLQQASQRRMPWQTIGNLAFGFGIVKLLLTVSVWGLEPLSKSPHVPLKNGLRSIAAGFASGAVIGLLVGVLLAKVFWPLSGQPMSPAIIVTLGPPFFLMALLAATFAEAGLLGSTLSEPEREYWSRIGAWMLIYALTWLVVFGLTLGGPLACYRSQDYFQKHADAVKWGAVFSWLATTGLGVLSGHSRKTRDGRGNRVLEWLGATAPMVFVAGFAVLVSVAATEFLKDEPWNQQDPLVTQVWRVINEFTWTGFLWVAGIAVASIALLYWCVDVNLFSLHSLYANRLVRCYLGASRFKDHWKNRSEHGAATGVQKPARINDPMTGLDAEDDIPLRSLTIGYQDPPHPGMDVVPTTYWGPLPIVNTALNLVSGSELAWQDRLAESFVLTPVHCGSASTGFRRLNGSADWNLTLGRAMAVSGAAANPNMGYHSSPGLTALMTVFNMRLGWWIQNPRYDWAAPGETGEWQGSGPGPGPWLVYELLGLTDNREKYVHLSDGGHFENLGLYELVRRRCKFIIVCDAGADPDYAFEDLAGAMRKCRTDFGVRIDIDVNQIRPRSANGRNPRHCVTGTIRYSDVHDCKPDADGRLDGNDGILLYIKSSLSGDESSDVLQYAASHSSFPHESTADQFFDEMQFESYRSLGTHIVGRAFVEGRHYPGLAPQCRGDIAKLFDELAREWAPQPASMEADFHESVQQYLAIHDLLRTEPALSAVSRELYHQAYAMPVPAAPVPVPTAAPAAVGAVPVAAPAAIPAVAPGVAPASAAELHFVIRLLQVMELAFSQVGLDEFDDHALNMGWTEIIRRWSKSAVVRRYWTHVRGDFSKDFQRYFDRVSKS